MKRSINTALVLASLFSASANASYHIGKSELAGVLSAYTLVPVGVSATAFAYGPLAGVGALSLSLSISSVLDTAYYQGLENEALEVLAGQAILEDQPALSLFKEDALANQEVIEELFEEQAKTEINLSELSNKEFAKIALLLK